MAKKKVPKKKHFNKPHKPKAKEKPVIAPAWVIAQVKKNYGCDCISCFKDFTLQINRAYNKVKKKYPSVPSNLRTWVKKKYDYHCQSCLDQFISEILTIHHIKPRWRGGSNDPDNLCPLCANCHIKIHSVKRTKNVYNYDNVLIYNVES
jgi:5-methylcytosine-specific restriction endonuclease McrA